jgi:beta-glucosidase-like glycosyl hydrolase
VEQAAVEHICAGGDLLLICHREDYIAQAYEELLKMAESDPKFERRVRESVRRVLAFKEKSAKMLQEIKAPSAAAIEKLSRKLWEFGEQVRLEALNRQEGARFSRP